MGGDTLWFRSRPSDRANVIPREKGVSREGIEVLYHDGIPDHLGLPADLVHPSAGQQCKVIAAKLDVCPFSDHDHQCRHFLLETEHPPICVAACEVKDQWAVYELPRG